LEIGTEGDGREGSEMGRKGWQGEGRDGWKGGGRREGKERGGGSTSDICPGAPEFLLMQLLDNRYSW